jgi:hypothetical protein
MHTSLPVQQSPPQHVSPESHEVPTPHNCSPQPAFGIQHASAAAVAFAWHSIAPITASPISPNIAWTPAASRHVTIWLPAEFMHDVQCGVLGAPY